MEKREGLREIPDELWAKLQALLPKEKPANTKGRPAISFRRVMNGVLYVLRTGCQWKMVPREYGSGSTCHRRFQEWAKAGIFKKLWKECLQEYDEFKGIRWEWQSLDSATIPAPVEKKGQLAQVQ